jgi:hypothetical protein
MEVMRSIFKLGLTCGFVGVFSLASAFASAPETQQALDQTKALLQNPNALKASGSKEEKAALDAVANLTKSVPGAEASMQSLSASIIEDVVKKTNGDPAAIESFLLEAQGNPGKFLESLSPQQQAEIRRIASEIDAKKK